MREEKAAPDDNEKGRSTAWGVEGLWVAGRGAGGAMGFRPSFLQRLEGDGTLWWGATGCVGGT